jgi:aspartate/methionine/tyrosine aminotransferase
VILAERSLSITAATSAPAGIRSDDMRAKITPRTRAILVINPNNPTGAVYPKEVLEKIVALAREYGLI